MANSCSNSVFFLAEDENLKAIRALFADIEAKQTNDGRWHLPFFATDEKGVMHDIVLNERSISYETRWVPNVDLLVEIADHFHTGFVSRFNEITAGVYGEARYDGHTLTMVTLDKEDFKAIRYNKQQKGYPSGKVVFEYEGDLLDYILEQKKANNLGVEVYARHYGSDPGR